MRWAPDKISEAVYDYSKTVFFLVLTVCVCIMTYQAVMFMKAVNGVAVVTKTGVESVTKDVHKLQGSVRLATDSMNRYVIRNKKIETEVVGTLQEVHGLVKDARGTLNETTLLVKDSRTFMLSANTMVQRMDVQINDQMLPEMTDFIQVMQDRTVLVTGDVSGLLQGSQKNLDQVTQDVRALINDPNIPLILKEVRVTSESGSQTMFHIAEITGDAAETTEYYKNKLINPSGWDRFKQVLNTFLYAFGEIYTPWAISGKIKPVEVIR